MNRTSTLLIEIATFLMASSVLAGASNDLGNADTLILVPIGAEGGEYRVTVEVKNDQPLAGLDIPLRFARPGDSITLDRVEWSSRVAGWEARSALIDNEAKTVIIGLISELLTARANADLHVVGGGDSKVATLVFKVAGTSRPRFEIYKTEYPLHDVTFFYNRYEDGAPHVEEFKPEFKIGTDR